MVQSVKCLTLDPSLGLDVRVVSSSPTLDSGVEPTQKERERERTVKFEERAVFSFLIALESDHEVP